MMIYFFNKKTGNNIVYTNRKKRVSKNPVAAFFQKSAKEQKRDWQAIVHNANKLQKELIES